MSSRDIPENAFSESKETLEPSNTRDEFVKYLSSECAALRELAWSLRKLFSDYDDLRSSVETGKGSKIEALLEAHRVFVVAETELNLRVEDFERRLHKFNVGKSLSERIYVSHTAEGLPIRVDLNRKIPIFGL